MRQISKHLGVLASMTTLAFGAFTAPAAHAVTTNVASAKCHNGSGTENLWSPKGRSIGVTKSWKCDGHGGYNGAFQWYKSDPVKVWAQMSIAWETGPYEQKNMTFGKRYTYNGAYSVYVRACDPSGCGGWW